jgi:hypothetical protein
MIGFLKIDLVIKQYFKFIYMKKLIFLLIPFLLVEININKSYAQTLQSHLSTTDSIGFLKVSGDVEINNKPLENSIVTVYENNNKISNLKTMPDGNFSIKLDFDKHYLIEVSKPGLVLKKFEFNTQMPDSADKHMIYPFIFKVVLFPKYKDIDLTILDKPLAVINYSKKFRDFFYDYNYSKNINEKVVAIQSKIENYSREYNKYIEEGNKQYILKQYKEALKNYKKANDLFPDDPEPKDKINSINKILKK